MRRLVPMLALAGCGLLDPATAQFERWQREPSARIAEDVSPTCDGATGPTCARLQALRAEACLARAMALRAPDAACPPPGAETLRLLDCAAESYAAARATPEHGFPLTTLAAHRIGRAQALACRAELGTAASGAADARDAAEEATTVSGPRGALLRGHAALFLARPGAQADDARCAAARGAEAEARRALAAGPRGEDAVALRRLAADATARRRSIPGCGD